MATTINASASSGLITTADTSTILQLQTAGTTALTVDASANVGIGTASPAQKLNVSGSGSVYGLITNTGTGPSNLFLGAGNGQTQIISRDATTGAVPTVFLQGTTESMRILSTGNILSLAGGSTTATGTGIAFPAVFNASSDINTLDDYEEGTYTPTVSYSGSTSGITYASRTGSFTKIGNVITVQVNITLTNKGTGSGSVIVSLPFTNRAERAGLAIGNTQGISANNSSYQAMVEAGLANVYFRAPSGLGSTTELGYSDINNSFYVTMSGVYLIS